MRSEVDRYLGWPGQAISYKVGERVWLEAPRRRASSGTGAGFDLKAVPHATRSTSAAWASARCATSSPGSSLRRDDRRRSTASPRPSSRYDGATRDVYRAGSGPGVVVDAARCPASRRTSPTSRQRVVDAGFTVAMPSLFGEPGRPMVTSVRREVDDAGRACRASSRPGRSTARRRSSTGCARSPATCTQQCGGPGVGAVGMCFTGGFALAMAVDDDDARARAQPAVAAVRRSARRASARSASPTPTSRA